MTTPIFSVRVFGCRLGRVVFRGDDLVARIAVDPHRLATEAGGYRTHVYYTPDRNLYDSVRYGPDFPTVALAVAHIMQNETELAGLLDALAVALTRVGGTRRKRRDALRIFDPTVPQNRGQ